MPCRPVSALLALSIPAQWASTYDAFRANFTSTGSEGGAASIDWGHLADLRAMNEAAAEFARGSSADPNRIQISEIADRLGEVRWQGMFLRVEPQESGGPVVVFNYMPLPEPLKIRFIADESEANSFSELQRGQIVAFTGRFDIKTKNEIDVRIRLASRKAIECRTWCSPPFASPKSSTRCTYSSSMQPSIFSRSSCRWSRWYRQVERIRSS